MLRVRTNADRDRNDWYKKTGGCDAIGGERRYSQPVSLSRVFRFKTRRTEYVTQVIDAVVVVSPISAASPK